MEQWLLLPGTLCRATVFDPLLAQPGLSPMAAARQPVNAYRAATAKTAARRLLAGAPQEFSVMAFSVMAFSLGAFVALELASIAGPRMRRMVLTGATSRADLPENRAGRLALCQELADGDVDDILRRKLWPAYVAPENRNDEALFRHIADMARDTLAADLADQINIALSRRDFRPLLHELTLPTLVLHGAEDAATPPDRGAEIAALLPRGTAHVIAGAGHFALMEQPAEMARVLADWLSTKGAI